MNKKNAACLSAPWRGDPPVTPRDALPEGFCYVHRVIPDAVMDIRYAGYENFLGRPADGYRAPFGILTREAAEALREAADQFRRQGLRIRVFDAYRPQRAVDDFVRWALDGSASDRQAVQFPDFGDKRQLLAEGYIARVSGHCRGSAVDLTLEDESGPLDMGTCFDYFGVRAWHSYRDAAELQKANRGLLRRVMTAAGFDDYEREWWHYRLKAEPFDSAFDFPVE